MVVTASVAISLDGYIDDSSDRRLVLSCAEDWAGVHSLRAVHQAIMVGAETLRRDNPSLRVKHSQTCGGVPDKVADSGADTVLGIGSDPVKVTVSMSCDLDPDLKFFTVGDAPKIVIVGAGADPKRVAKIEKVATVLRHSSDRLTARDIETLLESRGIESLLLEGGSQMLTMFLEQNCVDRLRVSIAPFMVGDSSAPRFLNDGKFYFDCRNRMQVKSVRAVGDMAVMEYDLSATKRDYRLLQDAVELSYLSPKSDGAYSVGAIIVTANGSKYTGYSRETDPLNHAEEEAILKALAAGKRAVCNESVQDSSGADILKGATIYSSMEPCTNRKSKPDSCTNLIIKYGFAKVVIAALEPSNLAPCNGVARLREAGLEVVHFEDLTTKALNSNSHIF